MIAPLVRLQAHPLRAHLHQPILDAAGTLPTEIVLDPDPHGKPSPLRTYRECVKPAEGFTHIVIVQDDVTLIAGFDVALTELLTLVPDRLVALFVAGAPRRSAALIREARKRGDSFTDLGRMDWVPTVALAWPVEMAAEFSQHLRRVPTERWADDPVVGGWCSRRRVHVIAAVPSLVQHPDLLPSLLPNDKSGGGKNVYRTAAVYSGRWP